MPCAEPAIDTHLHVWRLADGWYDWNTPALGAVHADAPFAEVAPAFVPAGVDRAVVVQAADHPAETEQLLRLAATEPRIAGAVGWVDLTGRLDRLPEQRERGLIGVRQLWHDHPDPDELRRSATLRALAMLGLPVDVPDAFPRLAPAVSAAVRALPSTRFVLDHAGKPPFGDAVAWPAWEDWFTDLARHPNVVIKLSGLFGGSGAAPTAGPAELARVVALTRAHAGAARTMIGSDWPMARGTIDHLDTVVRLRSLLSGWSGEERQQALAGTAAEVYGFGA